MYINRIYKIVILKPYSNTTSCVKGFLVEINDNLLSDPSLLLKKVCFMNLSYLIDGN